MKAIPGLIFLPLLCLVVILVTDIILWITLKRGNQTIQAYLEKQEPSQRKSDPNADTRWARADLQSSNEANASSAQSAICPACGAENSVGQKNCPLCGHKF